MSDTDSLRRQSDALHTKVRLYANTPERQSPEAFNTLALEIASYQAAAMPGSRRLLQNNKLKSWEDIPPVYVDSFRLGRVAAHLPSEDQALFMTSGTTSSQSGCHAVRKLQTYNELALNLGRSALLQDYSSALVVALAEAPATPSTSSLSHMMRLFIESFDGRAMVMEPKGVPFSSSEAGRFLVNRSLIDLPGLRRALRLAIRRNEPLLLLGTAFSLLALLETLDGETLQTPSQTRVMVTGGFKGKQTEVSETQLRSKIRKALGLDPKNLIGEYGMTELTSQLYEQAGGEEGVYFPPPWLRVDPVDPVTFKPLDADQVGLARFIDLGNIDSALAVVVQDQIQRVGQGIRLLGRATRAPLRGCSLPYESLLLRNQPQATPGERP